MFPNEKNAAVAKMPSFMVCLPSPTWHPRQQGRRPWTTYWGFGIHPAGDEEFMKGFKQRSDTVIFVFWVIALAGLRKTSVLGAGMWEGKPLARGDEGLDQGRDHGSGDEDIKIKKHLGGKVSWTWLNLVVKEGEESGMIPGFLALATRLLKTVKIVSSL